MSSLLNTFPIGDWLFFIFAALATIQGFRYGVMKQLTTLLSLVGGIWFASTYGDATAQFLVNTWDYMQGKTYIKTLGFVVAFLVAYLLILLVISLITRMLNILPFGFIGKLLGVLVAWGKLWAFMGFVVILCNGWPWFNSLFPQGSYGLAFGKAFVRTLAGITR